MGDNPNCIFAELQLVFYKRYKKVLNDLHLKNTKHEKNERVEVYYERLLKLADSLQHKTTNSLSTIVFKFGLQPYLCVATIGMKKETL